MDYTFYDKTGNPVAYLFDDEVIFLFNGEPAGYIYKDDIYSFKGNHLGFIDSDWVYDHDGCAVFYTEYSKGGPVKPVKRCTPVKCARRIVPVKCSRKVAPIKRVNLYSWSSLSSVRFFMQ